MGNDSAVCICQDTKWGGGARQSGAKEKKTILHVWRTNGDYPGSSLPVLGHSRVSGHLRFVEKRERAAKWAAKRNCTLPYVGPSDQWWVIMLINLCQVGSYSTPRRYNPCRFLADSRSRFQPSLSLALILQFLPLSLSACLITPSIHLRFGLPTRLAHSGLSKVIFLHGRLSCIHTICPAHLSLVILIVVT